MGREWGRRAAGRSERNTCLGASSAAAEWQPLSTAGQEEREREGERKRFSKICKYSTCKHMYNVHVYTYMYIDTNSY